LAAPALERVVRDIASQVGFRWSIDVLPITVAALMTPDWIARKVTIPPEATRVLLPGYCQGDLTLLQKRACERPVEWGPRDLRKLPDFFGRQPLGDNYGAYDIEIIAEINHAPRLPLTEI